MQAYTSVVHFVLGIQSIKTVAVHKLRCLVDSYCTATDVLYDHTGMEKKKKKNIDLLSQA